MKAFLKIFAFILVSGVILTTNVRKLRAKPLMTVAETDDEFSSTLESCPLSPLTDQDQSLLIKIPLKTNIGELPTAIYIRESSVLTTSVVQQILESAFSEPFQLTESNLKQLADEITNWYIQQNYITSIASPQLAIKDNEEEIIGEIQVIEGRLVELQIEGRNRVQLPYLCDRIKLGISIPFNYSQLEDQLRLLRINPLFESVDATLKASETEQLGESILVVKIQEANPFRANVGVDNYSPPSVGAVRWGVGVGYDNVSGWGDSINANYYRSFTGGSDTLDVSYRLPLNRMDGSLFLRVTPEWRNITQSPFDALDISGNKQRYEISYRQPIIRNIRQEFALSVGFTYEDDQTFLFDRPFAFTIGPDRDGYSRTRTFQIGQDYLSRDQRGSWALRSQFNIGTGLFNATKNDGSIPDGIFFAWLFQAQRVQILGENNFLIIQGDLQLTPDPLLPNQQFIIGGGQSVRGYRQNARSGDNGFRFSIEDRIIVARAEENRPVFQIAPFLEMGDVWNVSENPNQLPDQRFLIGLGLGVIWEPLEDFVIRLDYGVPIIDLDDRGNNIQDDGFYFSVNYRI